MPNLQCLEIYGHQLEIYGNPMENNLFGNILIGNNALENILKLPQLQKLGLGDITFETIVAVKEEYPYLTLR